MIFGQKTEKQADLTVFSIYDSKSGSYGQPMCAPNALALIREYESQWQDMVHNKSMLASHSEDYTLFEIGNFTFKSGKLETTAPTSVIGFHEIRTSVEARNNARRQQSTLVSQNQQ